MLFDLGSHCIDLIYYLCGEFASVRGMSQIAFPTRSGMKGEVWQTNADEAFYILCSLKNGAKGTISVSKLVNGANDDLNFAVYGEKGSLKFSLMQPNFLYYYDATQPQDTPGAVSATPQSSAWADTPRPRHLPPQSASGLAARTRREPLRFS